MGSPLAHICTESESAHLCHICTGTMARRGLRTPAPGLGWHARSTSAPGLSLTPARIWPGTGLTPAHICTISGRVGGPVPHRQLVAYARVTLAPGEVRCRSVACCLSHVAWCRLHVARCMLHGVGCMLHVKWCRLRVACCMLHIACRTLPAARRALPQAVPCRTLRGPVGRDYPRAPSPATAPPSLRNAPRCALHRCIPVRCTPRVARCTARLCVACRAVPWSCP